MPTFTSTTAAAPASTTLICSWGGLGSNTYVCLTDANSFITTGLIDYSSWTNATSLQKAAALIQATGDIDLYEYVGSRYYSDQTLKFPRKQRANFPWNNTVPSSLTTYEQLRMKEDVRRATCLQAIHKLRMSGRDLHAERRASGVLGYSETTPGPFSESFRYGSAGSSTNVSLSPEAISYLAKWMTSSKIFRA